MHGQQNIKIRLVLGVGGYPHVIRSQVLVYTCEFRHGLLSRLSNKGCQVTRMCVCVCVPGCRLNIV